MNTISQELTEEELSLLEEVGYSKKAIELYCGKANVGVLENPDVTLAYTSPCGDTIRLYLRISKDNVIEDAKFQYLGCPASAICGSVLTQIIKGDTLLEAKEITEDDVLRELDGLPDAESHCAKLAVTTLHKTILKYEVNKKRT